MSRHNDPFGLLLGYFTRVVPHFRHSFVCTDLPAFYWVVAVVGLIEMNVLVGTLGPTNTVASTTFQPHQHGHR